MGVGEREEMGEEMAGVKERVETVGDEGEVKGAETGEGREEKEEGEGVEKVAGKEEGGEGEAKVEGGAVETGEEQGEMGTKAV